MLSDDDIIHIPPLPVHSQATEFHVQVVKNVVTKYVGYETQEEHIKTKILARGLNTKFKKHYRKSDHEAYKS